MVMIGADAITRVIGMDVYDWSGERIGSAAEVYLDEETGQPEWVAVRTGLFGTTDLLFPTKGVSEAAGLTVQDVLAVPGTPAIAHTSYFGDQTVRRRRAVTELPDQ